MKLLYKHEGEVTKLGKASGSRSQKARQTCGVSEVSSRGQKTTAKRELQAPKALAPARKPQFGACTEAVASVEADGEKHGGM